MTLGQRIKLIRTHKGISQVELAKRCDLTRQTINNYEKDQREPTLLNAMCIADALGVSLDFLVGKER